MSLPLQDQRVLFIAPRFFGYEKEIAHELRHRGAIVDSLADRPFDTPFMKAVTRFRPELVLRPAERLYRRQLDRWGRPDYQIVLVVNGQTLSESMLQHLRAMLPRARFVLYMWDSFQNRRAAVQNLRFFDDCLTFDRDCAREYGLHFRPLFFSPGFARPASATFEHDLSFVGTAHTDRFAIVARIASLLPPEVTFFRYLYLQAPWVFHAYRLTNPAFRGARSSDFRFAPLPATSVQSIFFASRAILDIEHPRQTGLTIRTLETLGAARKLITTNHRVRDYDFFRAENICILDRRDAHVPVHFLEAPYHPPGPELYRRYSIEGWMDEVLNVPGARQEGIA